MARKGHKTAKKGGAKAAPFELGIVMAGAVSAGAYSAGVFDFLVEALDAYYEARDKPDWDGPTHDIRLRVVSGTSAGGITAALGAGALFRDFAHVEDGEPEPGANPLYDAWVNDVDIGELLGTGDLGPGRPIASLLDSTVLDRVADDAISKLAALPHRKRPWVDDPLALYLTATNLRGLPYGFDIFARGGTAGFGMTSHADELAFAVGTEPSPPEHKVAVDAGAPDPREGGWHMMRDAALATGAFPIGLAARCLKPRTAKYRRRPLLPRPAFGAPTWERETFAFTAVDGGVIDNEPLEIARVHLTGNATTHSPREGDEACRAVLLIDPFPNNIDEDPDEFMDCDLVSVARRLLPAMKSQARFKREELDLAIDPKVFSRFMIAPSRRIGNSKERREVALATGQLGGFAGFLARAYRRHDYLLGRRNCQSFLKRYFALPETNPLFAAVKDAGAWQVRERNGRLRKLPAGDGSEDEVRGLPIIPVVPELWEDIEIAAKEVPPPGAAAVDFGRLERLIGQRTNALLGAAIDQAVGPAWYRVDRWLLRLLAALAVTGRLTRNVTRQVRTGLAEWQ